MQPNHQLLAKHSASSDNVPGSIPAISTLDSSSSSTTTTASSSSSSASTSFTTTIVSTISDNSVVANFQNDDSTSPTLTETERATIDALPIECQESGTNYFVLKNCSISSLSQLSSSSSNQLQNLHSQQQQQPEEESSTISNNNNSSDIYEFCDDSNDDDIQIEDLCSNKHGGGGGADADPDENNPDDDCKDKSLIELYTDWLTNKTSQQQQPNLSSTTSTIPATITSTTTTTIPSSTSSTTNNTVKLSFSDSTKERADNLYNNLMKNSIQRISESLPLNSSTSSSCTVSSETLPFTSSSEVVASNSTTISFPKQLFGQTTSSSSGSDLFPIRKNSPWSWPNSNCTSTLTSSASSATTTTTSTSTSTYGSSNSSNVYVDNNYDINCDQLLLQHHLQQQQHQHQLMMNDSLSFGTMTGTNDGDDDDDDDQSNERKRLRLEDFMRQIVSQINSTSDKIWSDLLLDFTKNFAEYQVPYNKFVSNDYDLLLDIMTIAVKAMQSPEADRRIFSCQLLLNIVNLLNTELAESKVLPVLTVAVTNETCTTVRFNLCYVLAQLAPRLGFRSFVQTIYPLFQQMISATSAASSSSSSTTTTTTTTTSNSQTSTSILSQNPHLPTSSTIAICFSTLDSLIYLLPYLQDYLTSCLNCSDCRNFVSEIVIPATSSADSTTASKTENLHSQHHQLTLDELSHFISVEFIPFVKQLFEVLFDYIVLYRSMPSVLEQDSLECFLQWKDTNRNHESITQSLFGHFPDFNYFVLLLRDHGLAMDSWTTEPAECDNNNNDDCWYLDYFYKLYNFVFLSIGNNHLQDNNQLQYGGGFSRSSNLVSSSSSNFHNLNKLKFSNQHYSFCSKTNDATNNNNSTIVEDDDEIVDGDQDEINTKPNSVNLITDQASTNESTNSTLLVSVEEESTKIKFVTTESVTKQPIQSQQINTTSSSNGQSNNFIGKFQITESVNNNNNNKQQFDVFGLASSATASAFAIASSKTSITSGNNPDIFGFFEYKTIHCKSSLISVIPIIFDLYRVTKSSKLAKVVCDSTSELSPLKPTLAVNSNSGVCRTTTATTAASTATSSLSSEQQLFLVDRLIGTINSIIIDTNVEVMVKMINAFESLISRLTNPLRFYSILVNILQSQNIHVFNHLISNFFTIFSSMILNAVGSIRNMDSGSGNDGIGGDDVNSASNGDNVHSTIESVLVAFLKAEEFLSEKPNWRLYIQYLDVLLRLTRLVSMKSTKKLIVPRLLLRFETTRHIPCRQAISRCLLIIYIENFAELDFDRLIQDKIQRFDNQEQESKQHLDVDLFVWFEANLFNSTKYQMRQAFVDACAILLELFRTIRPDSVTKTPSDEGSKTQNLPKVDDNNNCNANHFLSDLRMLCPTMNSIDFQPKRTNQHSNNNNNGGFIPDNLASPPIAVVCNKLSKPLTSRLFLALLIQRHSLLQLLTSLATEDRVCTIRASAATVLRSLVQFFQKDILTSYAERSRASSLYCAAIESVFDYFDHFLSADGFEKFTAKTKLETDKLCSIEQQRFLHLIEECCENIYMLNKKSAMELATMDEDVEFCEINPVGNASDCGDENELVKSVQNEVNHLMDDLLTIVENELETDEDEEEDEVEELEVEELHEEELEEEEVDEDEFYLDDDEDDDEDNYYEIEQIINEKLSMNLPTLPKKTIIILGAEEEEEDDCYDDCDSTKMDTCPINEIDDELITSTSINQNQINGEEDVEMLLKSSSSSSSSTDSSSSSPDSSEVSTTDDSVSADQIKTEINKSISPCRGLIRIDSTLYNNSTTTTSSTTAPSTGASGNLTAANRKKKLKKNCSSSTTMVSASCTTTTTTASNGTTKSNNNPNNNQFSTKSIMSYHYPYSHSHNSNGAGGSPSNNSNNKRFLNSSMIPSMIASQQTVPAQQSHHQFFQYTPYHQVPQQQHQQIVGRSNTLKLAPIPPNNGTSPYLLTNPRQSSVSAHHQQQHGLSQSNTGSSSKKKNSSKTVRNYQQKSSPGATGPLSQGPLLQLPVSANHHSMNHHNQQQHHLTAQLSASKLPIMYKQQQQQQQQIAQYPPMLHSHHHHHPNNYPSPAASGGGAPFQQLIATPPNHHHHNHHHHPSHHHNHGNSNHVSSHHPSSTSSSSSFVPGPGSLPPPPPLSDPNLQFVHSNVSHKSASFHHNHHHGYSSPHHHHHGSPHNSHHNHHHNSNKLRGNISGSGGSRGGGGSGTGSNKHLRMVNGSGGGSTVANMPNNNRMMLMLNNNNNNYQQQPNNSNYLFNQNLNHNNNNNNQASMANVASSKNNKTIGTLKKSNTTNSNKSKTATVAPPPPSQTVVKVLQRNVIVPSSAISNSLPVSANTSSTTTTSGSGSLPVTQSLDGTNQVVEDNNNNDSDKKNNKKKKKNGLDLDKTGGMVDSGQNSDDLMNANQS